MQTFLPFPSYSASARCLDRQRLGKQRVEAKQIIMALTGQSTGWVNHPAVRMWAGHVSSLAVYGGAMCLEWRDRGYVDNLYEWFRNQYTEQNLVTAVPPSWLGNVDFHRSHQSNLLRKNPDHYKMWFLDVPDNLPYVWPTPEKQT